MNRRFWLRLGILVGSFLFVELILRLIGFGTRPVYQESLDYEYALRANQKVKRLNVEFSTNSLGMRSRELDSKSKLILGFGDSVINGGMAISQEELASSIIDSALTSSGSEYQFANISAGSWGVSNAFAWFMNRKLSDPEIIVLVFSSHDWNDNMDFKKVVGNVSFYPDSNPVLAITGFLEWIYSRFFEEVNWSELPTQKSIPYDPKDFDESWQRFIDYSQSKSIDLIVYHHADLDEVNNGQWTDRGIKLESYLLDNDVVLVSGLNSGILPSDYRDNIHLNTSGQRKMANYLLPSIISATKNE